MCKTWSTIDIILNKFRKTKSFPDAIKEDDRPISDKMEIAHKFNIYFTKIGSNLLLRNLSVQKTKTSMTI